MSSRTRNITRASVTNKKLNSPAKASLQALATPQKSIPNTQSSTGKRKRNESEPDEIVGSSKKKPKSQEEKRLLPFRKHAPKKFLTKLARAQTQRMIVIKRERSGAGTDMLCEDIDIVGSTGNIYRVNVGQLPGCTCPDHFKGNECKHMAYALHTVLKAPEHLQYQRSLLLSELEEIFSNAPPIPTDVEESEDNNGKRKPIDGECPICYMDLDEKNNELVWCKAACGNNMHKSCFDQWAASQRGVTVRCVYCRADWEMEKHDLKDICKAGSIGADGYINVAEHFGLSGARDYSSYYQPWARRHFGYSY